MTLYKNTPYLSDLQRQLGGSFAKIVATEIRTYQQMQHELEEAGAKRKIKKLPRKLRNRGSTIAGPLSLPRGETTQLPLLLRDPEGRPWESAHFGVHTNADGEWHLIGIQGSNGRIQPVDEPKKYEPDDLARANQSVESTLRGIDEVAQGFIAHAQSNPVGGAAAGPQAPAAGQSAVPPAAGNSPAAGSAPQAPAASGRATGRASGTPSGRASSQPKRQTGHRRVPGSQGTASTNTVPDSGRKVTKDRMKRFIRKNRSSAPEWARRLYLGRNRRRKKDQWSTFLEEIAIPCYKKAKGQYTYRQLWKMMEQQGVQIGFFDQYHCYVQKQEIGLDQQGRCTFADRCSTFEDNGNGICSHQSVQ